MTLASRFDRLRILVGGTSGDFATCRPFPTSETEYDRYLDNALEFVGRRNDRMTAVWSALDLPS